MDSKQKFMSSIERRRRNYAKRQKERENVQIDKIASTRKKFLLSQNITPEIYGKQEVYLKSVQVRPFLKAESILVMQIQSTQGRMGSRKNAFF